MKRYICRVLFASCLLGTFFSSFVFADDNEQQIYKDKTATYNYASQLGTITLENFLPGSSSIIQEAKALDAILVLDFSGSMTQSYSTHQNYNKVVSDKKYSYAHHGSYSDEVTDVEFYAQKYDYSMNKHKVKANYNGTDYQLYIIRKKGTVVYSSGNKDAYRTWLYITVNSQRIYVTPDGGFVKAGSTSPSSSSISFDKSGWPKDESGVAIPPVCDMDYQYRQLFCTYKTVSQSTTTRQYALEKAVGAFIDSVAAHTTTPNGLKNRIAIVSYSGGSQYDKLYANTQQLSDSYRAENYYLGSSYDNYLVENTVDTCFVVNNGTTPATYGWTKRVSELSSLCQVTKRFVDMSTPNAATILKHSINGMYKEGNTPTHAGVKIAKELMNAWGRTTDNGKDVARYIIVFSDGQPTDQNSTACFDGTMTVGGKTVDGTGKQAVQNAYDIKQSSSKPSIIYTIYCPGSGEGDATSNGAKFMQRLSSDYPTAQSCFAGTDKTSEELKYSKFATSNLSDIFNQITSQIIVDVNEKYGVNTLVADFINNQYFKLPDDAEPDDIKCYENACTGAPAVVPTTPTSDGYTWSTDSTLRTDLTIHIGRSATAQDTIVISGYNFTENWCGWKTTSGGGKTIHGNRLIINIPFTLKNNVSFGELDTNTGESGVYVQPKDSTGYKKDTPYPIPTIPFCKLIVSRQGLHDGESAIYLVKDKDGAIVDKISVNGTGEDIVSEILYGVPGETFTVEETNWNWAYNKDPKSGSITKTCTTTGSDKYVLNFDFKGTHIETSDESNPANMHNHDEAYARNKFLNLPTATE